jgi:hypothetical protein
MEEDQKISDLIELLKDAIVNFGDLPLGCIDDRIYCLPGLVGIVPVDDSNGKKYLVVG